MSRPTEVVDLRRQYGEGPEEDYEFDEILIQMDGGN
jgi:hypothetical protein